LIYSTRLERVGFAPSPSPGDSLLGVSSSEIDGLAGEFAETGTLSRSLSCSFLFARLMGQAGRSPKRYELLIALPRMLFFFPFFSRIFFSISTVEDIFYFAVHAQAEVRRYRSSSLCCLRYSFPRSPPAEVRESGFLDLCFLFFFDFSLVLMFPFPIAIGWFFSVFSSSEFFLRITVGKLSFFNSASFDAQRVGKTCPHSCLR